VGERVEVFMVVKEVLKNWLLNLIYLFLDFGVSCRYHHL